ncbi:hypothetical protein [Sutcliffiella horikoshii]|uniref:hypothetical protein n=1 Tax=Sutcliffiella horikoshii TaxID=79883 RepID=UPI001F22DE08|nr:hypothetical protein [Sutcliffiella horikoshii]
MSYFNYSNSKKPAGINNVITSASSFSSIKKTKKSSGCSCGKKKKIITEDK